MGKIKTLHNQVIEHYDNMFPRENVVVVNGKEMAYSERWILVSMYGNERTFLIVNAEQNIIALYGYHSENENFIKKVIGKNILEARIMFHKELYKTVCSRIFKDEADFSSLCKENIDQFIQDAVVYIKKYKEELRTYQEYQLLSEYEKRKVATPKFPETSELHRHYMKLENHGAEWIVNSREAFIEYAFHNCFNLIHFYHDTEMFPR